MPVARKRPGHLARFRDAGLLEQEDVLQRDDVLLHPDHFGDVRDAARAVAEARDLHEQIRPREAICWRMERMPMFAFAMPTMTSSRPRPSRGVLAWIVVSDPS